MKHTATTWYIGTLALLGLALLALTPDWDVDAWRRLIRLTARTSLLFFLAAYTASALFKLWPSEGSQWLRARRKQWGLLLLTSHGLHLLGILMFWHLDPAAFFKQVPTATLYSGGLAYAFLVAMGVTSHATVAKWLGRPQWSRLHTWGMHYLFLSFLLGNAKRIPLDGWYGIPVIVLVASVVLRQIAARRANTSRGTRPAFTDLYS